MANICIFVFGGAGLSQYKFLKWVSIQHLVQIAHFSLLWICHIYWAFLHLHARSRMSPQIGKFITTDISLLLNPQMYFSVVRVQNGFGIGFKGTSITPIYNSQMVLFHVHFKASFWTWFMSTVITFVFDSQMLVLYMHCKTSFKRSLKLAYSTTVFFDSLMLVLYMHFKASFWTWFMSTVITFVFDS